MSPTETEFCVSAHSAAIVWMANTVDAQRPNWSAPPASRLNVAKPRPLSGSTVSTAEAWPAPTPRGWHRGQEPAVRFHGHEAAWRQAVLDLELLQCSLGVRVENSAAAVTCAWVMFPSLTSRCCNAAITAPAWPRPTPSLI